MTEPVFDKSANTGLRHLMNAARFSTQGLASAIQHEAAFRQELVLGLLMFTSGAWLASASWQILGLFCAIMLVLVVELLNSGIEAAVDRTGIEINEYAKLAKDYGSAAVMLSLVIAGSIWCYILSIWLLTK